MNFSEMAIKVYSILLYSILLAVNNMYCPIDLHMHDKNYIMPFRHKPAESTAAASCPFFLAARYFPLLAFSATFDPFHSRSKKQLGDLG